MQKAQFWDGTHPLTDVQQTLFARLVPMQGPAPTAHGELLRNIANLYHDVYNNGFCNSEVLEDAIAGVTQAKSELAPLLASKASWRAHLRSLLKKAGKYCNRDDDPEEAGAKLEDIVAAVVRYVAAKEGVAVPA